MGGEYTPDTAAATHVYTVTVEDGACSVSWIDDGRQLTLGYLTPLAAGAVITAAERRKRNAAS